MKATIWHNPRCSKSREALALLREAGAEIEVIDYLGTPRSRAEIARIIDRAGLTPADVLRRSEAGSRALAGATDAAILDAMAADPILIERPLVETARGALLARPPARVRDIL